MAFAQEKVLSGDENTEWADTVAFAQEKVLSGDENSEIAIAF